MGITVLDGDMGSFAQIQPVAGGMKYWEKEPGKLLPHREFAAVEKLEFVQANTTGGGGFSPLWGAIGEEVIGPAGLLLGGGGKKSKEKIYFRCTLKDGRSFVGSMPPREYQNWRFLLTNKHAELINFIIITTVVCLVVVGLLYLMVH
jgi:hypothetical protein